MFDNLSPELRITLIRILLAIGFLLLVWLLRGVFEWILVRPLRGLASRSRPEVGQIVQQIIALPLRYLVVAGGLVATVEILGLDPTAKVFAQHMARTLVILAVFLALYNLVDIIALSVPRLTMYTGITVDAQLLPFVRTALQLIIIALAIVIVVQEWGYDVTGLIAGLGLGGLAFSLAAKDTVENLFGFSTIVGDRPFVVGEFIVTPDVTGQVEHVGLRSTRIRQPDQALVTVPNAKLASSVILNWSRLSKRWVNFKVGLDYQTTADQIRLLQARIRDMLAEREHVDKESIIVLFNEFSNNALNILVRCYVYLTEWVEAKQEQEAIQLEIMRILDELDIRLAFPSRSIIVENLPNVFAQEQGQLQPTGAASKESDTV